MVCLIEKQIDFETVHVDLLTGENHTPEFLKLQVSTIKSINLWFDFELFTEFYTMNYSRLDLFQ